MTLVVFVNQQGFNVQILYVIVWVFSSPNVGELILVILNPLLSFMIGVDYGFLVCNGRVELLTKVINVVESVLI